MPRQILKPIICAAAALLTWTVLPGTFIDRGLFSLTARTFAESPFFITEKGGGDSAFTLHTLKQQATIPSEPLPDIVITDDPDRVFQASPPSPVDIAIILKNLRRLGRDSIAIGTPLAWSETDGISLMALDQQLDALRSVVMAAPLLRGPVASPLPPAFRRASIAVSDIHGNARHLPIVNRVSIPDAMLGNSNSLAGFTALESEPDGEFPYLLARWDDRVVFSFPLLAALADHKVLAAKVEIRLGNYISLGKEGPYIPIDEFGRLTFRPPSSTNSSSIPAESLIDAPDDALTGLRSGTLLIRNGMSAADEASARFSDSLVPTVSLLADPSGTFASRAYNRIPWPSELLLIASVLCLLHGLGNFPKTGGRLALTILAGVIVIIHLKVVPVTQTWPPTFPALAAVLAAIPFTAARKAVPERKEMVRIETRPNPLSEFQHEVESEPAPLSTSEKCHVESAENSIQNTLSGEDTSSREVGVKS
jgi:hypothetical protein